MLTDWDVPIVMDDGLVLRADVFRPDDDGRHPVIMTHGPYAKWLAFQDGFARQWANLEAEHPDAIAGSSGLHQNWETVDPEKWVPDGYVVIRVDSRGAGRSPGYLDIFSPRETRDYYECIEWAAIQSWSTGKVGLLGVSYYAINQWQVAALRPPHLTAICPWEGGSDFYRDFTRHGGILNVFVRQWYPPQVAGVQHGVGERGPRHRATGGLAAGPPTLTEQELSANRADTPAELLARPLLDDYYAQRSPALEDITVPVLSAANWAHHLHTRGNFEAYARVGSKEKWLEVHGLQHWVEFYTDYGVRLQKRFFGHFLAGEETGWDAQPPVLLRVRRVDGTFEDRAEGEWPLARTDWTRFHLDVAGGRLAMAGDGQQCRASFDALGPGLEFWTEPLDADLEITGPCAARLVIASSTVDADVFVTLRVSDPEGRDVTFVSGQDPRGCVGKAGCGPRRGAAAGSRSAGRAGRRDLADLGRHPGRLPARRHHRRPRLRAAGRRAVAERVRGHHARPWHLRARRPGRPAARDFRRGNDAAVRRRQSVLSAAAGDPALAWAYYRKMKKCDLAGGRP
jgi:predicted acyl esterase